MSDELVPGAVAPELAREFPQLGLVSLVLAGIVPRRAPREVREHLRVLSSRIRGAQAVELRRRPVPQAYRVFLRQSGVDPDSERPPGEEVLVQRLIRGGFRSEGLVDDALTIALVETDVPVWALDADCLAGPLHLRLARSGEKAGRGAQARPVGSGRIVVADDAGPLAEALDPPGPGAGVTKATRRMLLYAVRVAGVPAIHVEEALWECAGVLRSA